MIDKRAAATIAERCSDHPLVGPHERAGPHGPAVRRPMEVALTLGRRALLTAGHLPSTVKNRYPGYRHCNYFM
ncbi:hypothetical protein BN6_03990 [Saccharothrix espanaensis DSM 44229]|uniref:Uncharacterized protein n=1 Tax=Saccharothrix espanaensis (strain ATCC 51144 / DSM 44229 / JCM 9112 / NBRC 15066 / NRRL 15764) TaxID=1179773 RepID=K0JNT2_SACES|nr:hypothetical protein BN6_03990 [Saccharothrix espanaensis DSM 44229]